MERDHTAVEVHARPEFAPLLLAREFEQQTRTAVFRVERAEPGRHVCLVPDLDHPGAVGVVFLAILGTGRIVPVLSAGRRVGSCHLLLQSLQMRGDQFEAPRRRADIGGGHRRKQKVDAALTVTAQVFGQVRSVGGQRGGVAAVVGGTAAAGDQTEPFEPAQDRRQAALLHVEALGDLGGRERSEGGERHHHHDLARSEIAAPEPRAMQDRIDVDRDVQHVAHKATGQGVRGGSHPRRPGS